MNQKQNNEQDYQNYFRRAMGVDANMRHHLATLIVKKENARLAPLHEALVECVEALGCENASYIACDVCPSCRAKDKLETRLKEMGYE